MRGRLAVPFCRVTGLGLGLVGGADPWLGHAADRASEVVVPEVGSAMFLYLALGCFGFAGYMLVRRLIVLSGARRRRGLVVRMVGDHGGAERGRGFMRRWIGWGSSPKGDNRWEQRTRTAEEKAEQALAVLRSELTPHLARIMRDRLVITLISQRARLLRAHQANAEKVSALEHRLSAIQAQVQRQADAYEQRISQLEKELQDKGAVTRELLRFRVQLARQALEKVRLSSEQVRPPGW
jgi:hypothetical protein